MPEDEDDEQSSESPPMQAAEIEYITSVKVPIGKRIAIPVRVEPKTYFATERTFLRWLEFSVYISSISVGLMTYADPEDQTIFWTVTIFTFTALLSIAYSAWLFVVRVKLIRKKAAVDYHDSLGPTILGSLLVLGVAVNLALRILYIS